MESTRFDCISMLTSNKTDWKIKVRMTRLWKSINSKTGDFKGYNMILLDDDEGKGQHFPEKLKDIIGKTLKLTLSLNTNNLIHGKTVYFASDVFEGVETTLNQNTTSSSEINAMVQDPPLNVDVVTKDMQPPSTKRTRNNDDGHNKKKKT
ncbi:hypothetical protein ACET3Z_010469 [Daucus carota]